MHKLILSPGDNKIDLNEYTRYSMEALEDRLGHKLNWYGEKHLNTDNHHFHVVIAGKIPDKECDFERSDAQDREEEAERRWLLNRAKDSDRGLEEAKLERKLDRNDLAELRAAGNEYRLRERSFDKALEKAWEKEFGRDLDKEREKDRERDRPQFRDIGYNREKADEMIDRLLEKTTDRTDEDRLIESTDGYSSFLDMILKQDKEEKENLFKDEHEKDLPPEPNYELDKLLEIQQPEKSQDIDKQKDSEDYQQRTGFAGATEQEKVQDDSWKTFEADRQVSEQQQSQEPE